MPVLSQRSLRQLSANFNGRQVEIDYNKPVTLQAPLTYNMPQRRKERNHPDEHRISTANTAIWPGGSRWRQPLDPCRTRPTALGRRRTATELHTSYSDHQLLSSSREPAPGPAGRQRGEQNHPYRADDEARHTRVYPRWSEGRRPHYGRPGVHQWEAVRGRPGLFRADR